MGDAAGWAVPGRVAGVVLFAGLAGVAVAAGIPFLLRSEPAWPGLNALVALLTLALAGAALLHACIATAPRSAATLFLAATSVSFLAEAAGVRTSVPFGCRYDYHPALRPALLGVPLVVPLMWFVLAYTPLVFLRPFRPGTGAGRRALKAAAGALYVTAVDLFLDPLATSAGLWQWRCDGGYFDTPAANFAGWFVVAFAVLAAASGLEAASGAGDPPVRRGWDAGFAAVSILLTLMGLAACVIRLASWTPVVLSCMIFVPGWLYWLAGTFPPRAAGGERGT